MLNSRGVSQILEEQYSEVKSVSKELHNFLDNMGDPLELLREENLIDKAGLGVVIYVKEGYLKLLKGNREIRMFSDGDFIFLLNKWSDEYKITSDFKCLFTKYQYVDVINLLSKDNKKIQQMIHLHSLENKMLMELCGEFAPEIIDFEMVVKNYSKGDIIIEQGQDATDVFEMINGEATAFIDDIEVGKITKGEIFGELGLLIDNTRKSTVIADRGCFVRILEPQAFFYLIESNQHFSISIMKKLALQIDSLSNQIVKKTDI